MNTAQGIIDWYAAVGVPRSLTSDDPTQFKNYTLRYVSGGQRFLHFFTIPYTPCSSAAVGRLGKQNSANHSCSQFETPPLL